MPYRAGILWVIFSLAMGACTPAVQVRDAGQAGIASPSATALPATKSQPESLGSLPAKPPEGTPAPALAATLAPVKTVPFEESVLVAAWFASKREHRVYPLDPGNGQALPGYAPVIVGETFTPALSPDRRTLALATQDRLQLVDLYAWSENTYELEPAGHVTGLVFDPGGRRLAIVSGDRTSELTVFDLEKERVTAQRSLEMVYPRIKFTAGGRGLMVYGAEVENRFTSNEMAAGPPHALLLDPGDLSLRWSVELEGVRDGIFPQDPAAGEQVDLTQPASAVYLNPALVFDPSRDVLYVVHADEDKLTTVDFAAQRVETVEIHTELTWFERLLALTAGVARAKVAEGTSKQAVISPDGGLIYVLGVENTLSQDEGGEWRTVTRPLGLQVIRVADGSRLDRFETGAYALSISPGGHSIYLVHWDEQQTWTEVFDPSRGEVVERLEGNLHPALRMNGETILIGSDYGSGTRTHQAAVNPERLDEISRWAAPPLTWLSAP